jgi:hypothetical protein
MRDRFYRLLGMLAWNGAKLVLRRKLGPPYGPKLILAATLALAGVIATIGARHNGSDS